MKNSAILFIANFGSQILSFFLVPLYTYVLSKNEYGTSDIFTTTISIIVPIVTLSISEATLRFAMDKKSNNKTVLSISLGISIIGVFASLIFMPLIGSFTNIGEYSFLLWLAILFNSLYLVTANYCRGNSSIKKYAIGGVLSTLSSLLCCILLLVVFKIGIKGYLISFVVSYAIPTFYYVVSNKMWRQLDKIDLKLVKEMISYSIPMIPGAIAWLMMTSFDKYVLVYSCGAESNGIYAIAQKVPALINVINSIFMQSWQVSAIAEMDSEDRDSFYSNVFNTLAAILLIITSCVIAIIKPFYGVWLEESYFEAWKYTPILMVANIFSCFSNFVGANYFVTKKTTGNMKTLLFGALVNVVLSIIFVKKYGIYAAAITTLVGFMFTWIYRMFDTRNTIKIKIDAKKIIFMLLIICIQYLSLYNNQYIYIQIVCMLIVMFVYKNEIASMFMMVKKLCQRKK